MIWRRAPWRRETLRPVGQAWSTACSSSIPARSWAGHGVGAVKIGVELLGAGCAAIIHAVVPGCFTETAGKTVTRIYDHIQQRKAGAAKPESWPDYEI
jgi:hypothetical protein